MKLKNLIAFLFEDNRVDFGKYLFGASRKKPNERNPERNTPAETDLELDLMAHYTSLPSGLKKWIGTLDKLEKSGKYTDVLTVPDKYKYAYRVMSNVSLEDLTKILGYEPTSYEAGQIYEEDVAGGTFSPRSPEEKHSSWTVNVNMFKLMQKETYTLSKKDYEKDEFLVFLRAPIRDMGNRFLLNPDETKYIARKYSFEEEVLSVGTITCDHVWYMPLKSKPVSKDITHKQEKEAISHIAAYEKDRNRSRR